MKDVLDLWGCSLNGCIAAPTCCVGLMCKGCRAPHVPNFTHRNPTHRNHCPTVPNVVIEGAGRRHIGQAQPTCRKPCTYQTHRHARSRILRTHHTPTYWFPFAFASSHNTRFDNLVFPHASMTRPVRTGLRHAFVGGRYGCGGEGRGRGAGGRGGHPVHTHAITHFGA